MASLSGVQTPQWPGVALRFTTRQGGVSQTPYDTCNLGAHVGDDPDAVSENRRRVSVGLPGPVVWLDQVHGVDVLDVDACLREDAGFADRLQTGTLKPAARADAALTSRSDVALAVMVADCLPVALADNDGQVVAVAHAGWRGLAAGVLEQTLQQLRAQCPQAAGWRAWIGPAIGPTAFEVGDDVRRACLQGDPHAQACFTPRAGHTGKWWADLTMLARRRLARAGVEDIQCAGRCTYSEPDAFFSFRRDGGCGRMAVLAWRSGSAAHHD